jgi:hypothetical protein
VFDRDRDFVSSVQKKIADPEEAEHEVVSNSDACNCQPTFSSARHGMNPSYVSILQGWGVNFTSLGLIRRPRDGARENNNAEARQPLFS